MINLVLTFDYEIFGNGSGNVRTCLIDPTDNILALLDRYNAKATFFVDYGLLQALEKYSSQMRIEHFGYDPLLDIWEQLYRIIEKHDIQLHIHPQMIDAPIKNGRFQVDLSRWRISDLPYSSKQEILSINGLIKQGKKYFEDKIRKGKENYHCFAFRAGGLCAQPEQNLLRALKENDFIMDFSTSYKYFIDAWPAKVDYRKQITDVWPRLVKNSYSEKSDTGIWIFPIFGYEQSLYSRLCNRIRKLFGVKKKDKQWSPKRPRNCDGKPQKLMHQRSAKDNDSGNILKSLKNKPIFRFYLEGKKDIMINCFNVAYKYSKKRNIYMVGIGHPKAMGDLSQLELFFQYLHKFDGKFRYLTTFDLKNIITSGLI